MTEQLTNDQHFVPCCYQKGWTPTRWQETGRNGELWGHDLKTKKAFPTTPKAFLHQHRFYEEDKATPNNEFEKWFHDYEGPHSGIMRFLDRIIVTLPREAAQNVAGNAPVPLEDLGKVAQHSYLTSCFWKDAPYSRDECLSRIKRFAAVSYARTPAIIKLKFAELNSDPSLKNLADMLSKPYSFMKLFQESTLMKRFEGSKMHILFVPEGGLVGSDRPCFDFPMGAKMDYLPEAGFDFMRKPDVGAMMPLSEYLVALFLPQDIEVLGKPQATPLPEFRTMTKPEERLCINQMTINFALQFVFATKKDPSIFDLRTWPLLA